MSSVANPVAMSTQHLPLYLIHVDSELVADIIGGQLVVMPPGEITEFPNRFFGRKFMEHMHMHGVVEVPVSRDRSGIHFHVEDALAKAKEALDKANEAYVNDYIQTQHNDRMGHSRPPLPPSPRQRRIIKARGVNLEDYNIVPIGSKSRAERFMELMAVQNQILIQRMIGGKVDPTLLQRLAAISDESGLGSFSDQPTVAPAPDAPKSDFVSDVGTLEPVIPEARSGGIDVFHEEGADLESDLERTRRIAAEQLGTTVEALDIADEVPGAPAPEIAGEPVNHPVVQRIRQKKGR